MKPAVEVSINGKKSNLLQVRGTAWIDGIKVPFTAYRTDCFWHETDGPAHIVNGRVVVRSSRGIIKKFDESDYIRNKLRDAAKCWWIDKNFWR